MSTATAIGKLINIVLRPVGVALHRTPPKLVLKPLSVQNLPQSHFVDCRVLSSRSDLLEVLPREGVVAEIGVADGNYSAEILNFNRPAILHLVDPWDDKRYVDGFGRVRSRFAREIATGHVVLHHGRFIDVLPALGSKSLDWVYLDTTHTYADTAQELRLCTALVRDGGRIAGHDFCLGDPYSAIPFGVIQAVYEFCAEHEWGFEYISLDGDGYFSFCLKQI